METPGRKLDRKVAQGSYHPLKLGCVKKLLKSLVVSMNYKAVLQQSNPLQYCTTSQ